MGTVHLLRTLLPHDSVALGRLVRNANRPHQNYIDPLPPRPGPAESHIVHHTNFSETRKFSKDSSVRFSLGELVQLVSKNDNTSTATLTAPNTTTYDLSNSDDWFRDTCKQEDSRRWLEEAIDKNQNVYLVVGFRTAQHASLTSSVSTKKASRAAGELPLRSLAPLTLLDPALLSPIGGGTQSRGRAIDLAFEAPGEQVFAVLYRKVKFSWLSSRKTKNMKLEVGNRWKSVWEWRGPNDMAEDDEDDVLEAELTDSSDLDTADDEYDDEEDDEFGDKGAEVEKQYSPVNAMLGTGGGGQQAPGDAGAEEVNGGSEEVCKTSEVTLELGLKQSTKGTLGPLVVWGMMFILFLLLCQWFFQWGR